MQSRGQQFHDGANAIPERHGSPTQQRFEPTAPPGDAVHHNLRVFRTARQQHAGGAANAPTDADRVPDGKHRARVPRLLCACDVLQDRPATANGSIHSRKEHCVGNDVRGPRRDRLITAARQRSENNQPLLDAVRQ